MTKYIYSTLSNDQIYPIEQLGGADLTLPGEGVFIRGGSNVADKNGNTSIGVMTAVSDEVYEQLQKSYGFIQHLKNGFLKVETGKKNAEAAVSDLQNKDGSAPLTENDFSEDGPKPVSAGEVKVKKVK